MSVPQARDLGRQGVRVDKWSAIALAMLRVCFLLLLSTASSVAAEDTEPVPISRPGPQYPVSASLRGIEGRVVVQFTVTSSGSTADLKIAESSMSELLDNAAIAAVSQWKYRPATANGKPVPRTGMRVALRFEIPDEPVQKAATPRPATFQKAAMAGTVIRVYIRPETPPRVRRFPYVGTGKDVAQALRNLEVSTLTDSVAGLQFSEIVCDRPGWWAVAVGTLGSNSDNVGMACGGDRDPVVSAAIGELKKQGFRQELGLYVWYGYANGRDYEARSQPLNISDINLNQGQGLCEWAGTGKEMMSGTPGLDCIGSLRRFF